MSLPKPGYIKLFGKPVIVTEDCEYPLRSRELVLVLFLATAPEKKATRELLSRVLWPHASAKSARHSLSQLLYAFRLTSGFGDYLRGTPSEIALTEVSVDLDDFFHAVHRRDARGAAELYRGNLSLPKDCSELAVARLQQITARICTSATELLGMLAEGGAWKEVGRVATLVLQIDPLSMEGARALACSAAAAGDRREAEAILRELQARWRAEIGELPRLDFAELEMPEREATASFCFVGREEEFRRLRAAVDTVETGGGSGFVLVGEAGIGKTAVLQRFRRLLALRCGESLTAAGYALERHVPFGALEQWLRSLSPGVTAQVDSRSLSVLQGAFPHIFLPVAPEVREIPPAPAGRLELHAALATLFVTACAHRPLGLILDDAHCADDATLAFVNYLSRRLPDVRLILLLATRKESLNDLRILSSPYLDRIDLSPLTNKEVALAFKDHCRRSGRPFSDNAADELYARTGGVPLLLSLLLGDGDVASGTTPAVPTSIVQFYEPRLSALSGNAILLLAAMSIVQASPAGEHWADILGLSHIAAQNALLELEKAGFLAPESATPGPRHGLVAEAALARLSASAERALRGRAARVLAEEGMAPPAAVAAQFDFAGEKGKAFHSAQRAAKASLDLYAHREAEFFFKIAFANAPDVESRAKVRLQLADLLLSLGRKREACELLDSCDSSEAAELGPLLAAERLLVRLADADGPHVIRDATEQFVRLEPHLAPEKFARLLRALSVAAHDLGLPQETVAAAERSYHIIPSLRDEPHKIRTLVQSSAVLALYGHMSDSIERMTEVLPSSREWPEIYVAVLSARGSALIASARLHEAEADLSEALEIVERLHAYEHLFLLHNNLGVCYQEQGRYREARGHYDRAYGLRETGAAHNDAAITIDNLAILSYEEGDLEAAIEIASRDACGQEASPRSYLSRTSIRGLASLALGRTMDARECHRNIEVALEGTHRLSNDVSYIQIFRSRMARMSGQQSRAAELLQESIADFSSRDYLCATRMHIELMKLQIERNGALVEDGVLDGLQRLQNSGAVPLLDALDAIRTRIIARRGRTPPPSTTPPRSTPTPGARG